MLTELIALAMVAERRREIALLVLAAEVTAAPAGRRRAPRPLAWLGQSRARRARRAASTSGHSVSMME